MKPYGIPRVPEVEFPDVADIRHFGRKTSIGRLSSKGRGYSNGASKRTTRRYWKRCARRDSVRIVREAMEG